MHAHVTPERYKKAIRERGEWHGLDAVAGELGLGGFDKMLDQRLAEMDSLGVDMQLVTPTVGFYQYGNELDVTRRIARECNDEIAEMVAAHPARFSGLATLPMQDPPSAIAEMERAMTHLGLKGVIISDHVAGRTYDEPDFLPFFTAAEELGAIVFFHQGGDTVVSHRISRYKLGNAVGNLTERALVFATLVFGGVLDRCPELKPYLAHGGGFTSFGVARMDKVAGALEPDSGEGFIPPFGQSDGFAQAMPPSDYLGPVRLRLMHIQRARPALPDRRSRHRPRSPGHRLSSPHGPTRRGQLGERPCRAECRREGGNRRRKPGQDPGLVVTEAGETLGWGIIGIGNIVRSTMAPAMLVEPACDLVAAVSRDQGRADEFAQEFGARFAYAVYEEMLANPEVEAVFIATPNLFHADQVVAAADAGKHVFCDKPLGINVADARRALDACESAGVSLGVNFHNRHLPWVRDVSRLIAEKTIGAIQVIQLQVASGPRHYDNWRADPVMAGLGSVHNVGVHGLDFLRVLLQSDPVEVMAMFDRAPGSGEVEMLALIQLRFENGVMVQYNANETVARPSQRHRDLWDRRPDGGKILHTIAQRR